MNCENGPRPSANESRRMSPLFRAAPPEGVYIRLTVSDNGSGMGLAVVMGIVRGHGGTLSAESVPGWGTVVKVLLPALAETATETPW